MLWPTFLLQGQPHRGPVPMYAVFPRSEYTVAAISLETNGLSNWFCQTFSAAARALDAIEHPAALFVHLDQVFAAQRH